MDRRRLSERRNQSTTKKNPWSGNLRTRVFDREPPDGSVGDVKIDLDHSHLTTSFANELLLPFRHRDGDALLVSRPDLGQVALRPVVAVEDKLPVPITALGRHSARDKGAVMRRVVHQARNH